MYAIRRAQGRLAEVAPMLRRSPTAPDPPPMWRPGLAALYAELGLLDDAGPVFESLAPTGSPPWPATRSGRRASTFLAETCLALGDADRAVACYDELLVFRGRNLMVAFTVCFGPADRLLGGLAALLGRRDVADAHFRAAIELAERSGSPLWTAEVQFDWATALPARGDVCGGRTRSTQPASDLGLRSDRATASSHAGTTAKPTRRRCPPGCRRARSRCCAGRRAGCPTARSAPRLFISQNTVANHVRAILRKTGCANRTEATTYAHRTGVIAAASPDE